MKGRVDDRADDEERQKGREYERRKALKERGRDREVSSGFFLAPHFSSPSAFQSKLASTDRLRSDVFILLARGAKKVKLLIKGNTGETSQICTSYQQLYRAWGTLKHECVHARVCSLCRMHLLRQTAALAGFQEVHSPREQIRERLTIGPPGGF